MLEKKYFPSHGVFVRFVSFLAHIGHNCILRKYNWGHHRTVVGHRSSPLPSVPPPLRETSLAALHPVIGVFYIYTVRKVWRESCRDNLEEAILIFNKRNQWLSVKIVIGKTCVLPTGVCIPDNVSNSCVFILYQSWSCRVDL